MLRRKEIPNIIAAVPSIGDGNPLQMETAVRLLRLHGNAVDAHYISFTQLPAQLFHVLMTMSRAGTDTYTQHGERVRESFLAKMLGIGMWNEFCLLAGLRKDRHGNNPRIGVVVQEMIIGAVSRKELQKRFDHVYLLIPDVHPKQNAVAIMQKFRGIVTPVVWNVPAYNNLQKQGLDPILVKPEMLHAFVPNIQHYVVQNEYTLVKTSGSGIPPFEALRMHDELKKAGMPFEFHHPQIIVNQKVLGLTVPIAQWRRQRYMENLAKKPPKIFKTLPSEQAQIVVEMILGGWNGKWEPMPFRGPHEKVNSEELRSWGLGDTNGSQPEKKELQKFVGTSSFPHALLDHFNHL